MADLPSLANGPDQPDFPIPLSAFQWWSKRGGTIFYSSDPARPAILLLHGLGQTSKSWTEPSYVGVDLVGLQGGLAYDYTHTPDDQRIGQTHKGPNAGIYKLGSSDLLYGANRSGWDEERNWFDRLAEQDFTVATWTQPSGTLDQAYPSAEEVFDHFVQETHARSPGAPPPIALIGHSRGGLLIRKLLKERGSIGRVRWVVTLHSPHTGSELARAPAEIGAEIVDLINLRAPALIKEELKEFVVELLRPLNRSFLGPASMELVPDGPLLGDLTDGEKAAENVKYYTFGGVNPNFFRLYAWHFDTMSAVPQFKGIPPKIYFVWRVKAAELDPLSPLLDKVRDFVPEVKPGQGDGLVADARARLPFGTHMTTGLNHVEVLWDRDLQRQVVQFFHPH